GIQDTQENDQIGGHTETLCRCMVCHAPPATASAEGGAQRVAACSASARHQLNGAPFPATASAEGARLNGRPSPTRQAIVCKMRYNLPPRQPGAYSIV